MNKQFNVIGFLEKLKKVSSTGFTHIVVELRIKIFI